MKSQTIHLPERLATVKELFLGWVFYPFSMI